MKTFAACLMLFFMLNAVTACVWITGTKYNGDSVSVGKLSPPIWLGRLVSTNPAKKGAQMEYDLRDATDFNDRSDYSVALMYLGRPKEAVERLKALEQEKPGQYFIAANLGTAYELTGDDEDALHWIQEGIHRDPASHYGTEWLHVKILEVKIAAKADPDYFKKHTVLDLHPGDVIAPLSFNGQVHSPKDMEDALQYQLEERVQFVKPRDSVVANLLFDYATIEAMTNTLESAEGLLQLALEYGYPPDQIQPLMQRYDHQIASRKTKQTVNYTLIGLAALGSLLILYQRGIFVLSSRDLKQCKLPKDLSNENK